MKALESKLYHPAAAMEYKQTEAWQKYKMSLGFKSLDGETWLKNNKCNSQQALWKNTKYCYN